jgi:hypothetical protein
VVAHQGLEQAGVGHVAQVLHDGGPVVVGAQPHVVGADQLLYVVQVGCRLREEFR